MPLDVATVDQKKLLDVFFFNLEGHVLKLGVRAVQFLEQSIIGSKIK